jgi:hypothetical protein
MAESSTVKVIYRSRFAVLGVRFMREACPRIVMIMAMAAPLVMACRNDSRMTSVVSSCDVEIAPGKWLAVAMEDTVHSSDLERPREDPHRLGFWGALRRLLAGPTRSPRESVKEEESYISFDWAEKKVEWRGKPIPVTLREQGGRLFFIGFDRGNLRDARSYLRFFSLNQEGTRFVPIEPGDFPRRVATQNMWLHGDARYWGTNSGLLDSWALLRTLDVDNVHFSSTLTARIWYQIESNREDYLHGSRPPDGFVEEYAKKYKPIPLPTLVKEKQP